MGTKDAALGVARTKEHSVPEQYLDLAAVGERAGLTVNSMRTYHKLASRRREEGAPKTLDLPAPDLLLGRTPGWRSQTIDTWLAAREARAPERES